MAHSISLAGDAFLEEFLPVIRKPATSEKAGANVYELLVAEADKRRNTPGGVGLLGVLLGGEAEALRIELPTNAPAFVALLQGLIVNAPGQVTVGEGPSATVDHVRNYYAEDAAGRWALQMRCDLHLPRSSAPSAYQIPKGGITVIDDHGRGAVDKALVEAVLRASPARIILFAQHDRLEFYAALRSHPKLIVVCTERQALSWIAGNDPPPRLPDGSPTDHVSLLKLIAGQVFVAFGNAAVLVTRVSSAVGCYLLKLDGQTRVALYAESRGLTPPPGQDGVPGLHSAFLAGLALALSRDLEDLESAMSIAIARAHAFSEVGVRATEDHFGRPEALPQPTDSPALSLVESWSTLPSAQRPLLGFLTRAQFHGRLQTADSPLRGFFVPAAGREKLTGLLRAAESYVSKARKRPLNILLYALPGSGKSYFAQCLVRHLNSYAAQQGHEGSPHTLIEANFSAAESFEGVVRILNDVYESVRDERALGQSPLVLLDEFDSIVSMPSKTGDLAPIQALFSRLLTTLWDGVFSSQGRQRRLGGFVLLFAASGKDFEAALSSNLGKSPDFRSRIDVRLDLGAIENAATEDAMEAKARLALAMIGKHFPATVSRVELAVLDAIAHAQFRSNRAIDQMIMLSSEPSDGLFALRHLPSASICTDLADRFDEGEALSRFGKSWIRI